jgi:sulfite reductase (NADPH) flavoprotein alpha-component
MQTNTLNARTGPLSTDQANELSNLVGAFTVDQLTWTSGYLAGLAARQYAPSESIVPVPQNEPSALTILYGSQTGNGRTIAERLHKGLRDKSIAANIENIADYRLAQLKKETEIVIVVSTHGEGDPPDDAEPLYDYLFGKKAPRLEGLRYSVLSLGDSSYEFFCKTGKDLDQRLAELGAVRVHQRVDCDIDFEDPAEKWLDAIIGAAEYHPSALAASSQVAYLRPVEATPQFDKTSPFAAELLTNQRITGRDSAKDVRHIELSLQGSGMHYEPGDSLGVMASNPPELVDQLLQALNLNEHDDVTVNGKSMQLRDALGSELGVTALSQSFLAQYAQYADSDQLNGLLTSEDRHELAAFLADRQIIDVVNQYPVAISAAQLVTMLRRMTPRLYSIASSQSVNPEEAHLTVDVVRYQAFGSSRQGAASTYLAGRTDEDQVNIFIESNPRFRLPADADAPIVMVGPGTGVAPFRAFVEERSALSARGKNWLFFGAQHFSSDFLYQLEWLRHLKRGALTKLDVAFSRDQAHKIYVQHRLLEHSRDVYAWLEEGAYFYVCGDANHMAKAVHETLIEIVSKEGSMSSDKAAQYVKDMKQARRYQRDVY